MTLEKRRRTMVVALPPYGMERTAKVRIHDRETCGGKLCPFHKPSKHHMAKWPKVWRTDRRDSLIERKCEHGVGHPDPDSLAFIRSRDGDKSAERSEQHGCDGCCSAVQSMYRDIDRFIDIAAKLKDKNTALKSENTGLLQMLKRIEYGSGSCALCGGEAEIESVEGFSGGHYRECPLDALLTKETE